MPLQLSPEHQQALSAPQETPEWLRVLAQYLSALAPTGPTGAALSMGTQAQPQTAWGQLASLAPLALGVLGTIRHPPETSIFAQHIRSVLGFSPQQTEKIVQSPHFQEFFQQYSGSGQGGMTRRNAITFIQRFLDPTVRNVDQAMQRDIVYTVPDSTQYFLNPRSVYANIAPFIHNIARELPQ